MNRMKKHATKWNEWKSYGAGFKVGKVENIINEKHIY